jgi:S-(hydroxymethyl)glutathione dehydrogenase / alcohol dehydrogenase
MVAFCAQKKDCFDYLRVVGMLRYKAAVLRDFNKVNVEEVSCENVPDRSVAVKVILSGVCRSQLMEYRGARGQDKWLPHLFGHEAVGEVIEVGCKVKNTKIKDKVILTWIGANSNSFVAPEIIDSNGEKVNSGRIATISEIAIVHEECCIKKPNFILDEVAVLFGCALGTGSGIAMQLIDSPEKLNLRICVIGLGGVGMSALMTLLAKGCKNIVAVDQSLEKVDWCKNKLNVEAKLFSKNWVKKNKDHFDLCIEASGTTEGIEAGLDVVKKGGGEIRFASHPPDDQFIKIKPHDLISGKIIRGSWGGEIDPKQDFSRLAKIFKTYQELLISTTGPFFKLSEIQLALMSIEKSCAFRPIIDLRD